MATVIKSRHAIVSRPPYMLYMGFVDMRNFIQFLPEDKKKEIRKDKLALLFKAVQKTGTRLPEPGKED